MSEATGVNSYRAQRLSNMQHLAEKGHKPFGAAFERTGLLSTIRAGFEEGQEVKAAGRLMIIRGMGKAVFADLNDGSDRFQIFIKRDRMSENDFEAFKYLDIGDHIGVTGTLFTTRMGEKTIMVQGWKLLSKALLPLPEKWHGLKDTEQRYRQRYLDLISNPDVRQRFNNRIAMIREIRNFLHGRGYQEVETPMMQIQAGGAAARPFITRYEALNCNMYMRIAPELYLKRLLVGGFDKVFELNRNFRNEGLDRTHNPEFTMLELYEAYADVRTMQKLIQDLITHVAREVFGTFKIEINGQILDLTTPYREASYHSLIRERMGEDWFSLSLDAARRKALAEGLDLAPDWGHLEITHEVYEKLIEKNLFQPTFVTRLPRQLIPLAKACEDDPDVVDVFELVINGQEVAPAYTEMNDPLEQRRRFEEQAGCENIDEAFIEALEHGMPPAGGMGVGIDRLAMILSGVDAIRDIILFPQLRREG